ncbi:MAG: ankyrin repeat domain-containing protein [Desulfomonile tiedjei]|nr:ankyrin repeat domain-containing protein [Desulfomonile tiedjei]
MDHTSSDTHTSEPKIRCFECKHLVEWPFCLAFLSREGIPEPIRSGRVEHDDPYPGDHGIRFLPVDAPYELSEEAVKGLLVAYRGEVILPVLSEPVRSLQAKVSEEAQSEAEPVAEIEVQIDGEFQTELASRLSEELDAIMDDRVGEVTAQLFDACRRGDLDTVRNLLDLGPSLNIQDVDGNTPLMVACRHCHLDVVRLLLIKGSDVHMRNSYSKSALDIATDWGYPTIVQLLKAYGAQESDPSIF